MNGASNSGELRALIRAENRNPAKRSPKLDNGTFAGLAAPSMIRSTGCLTEEA